MSSMTDAITIRDVGPIHELEIPLPREGGVVVLYGRNGRGKSKALEAVDSLVAGRGKIEARDGTKRGEVDGFGARLTVARSTRRSGQAEVVTLEGRLNVADLVQPKIKDPAAADAYRIKALVQLAGVEASAERFAELLGGMEALREIVPADDLDTDDPVQMAARVKRRIEAAARAAEAAAEHAQQEAAALARQADAVNLDAPCDGAALQADLEARLAERAALIERARASAEAQQMARAARRSLDEAADNHEGVTVEQAQAFEQAAHAELDVATAEVERLRASLHEAEHQAEQRRIRYSGAIAARKAAERHEAALAVWREQVAAAESVELVPQADLDAAEKAVKAARHAVETGVLVRQAHDALADAEAVRERQAGHEKAAERLRDAAHGTDEVLSMAVGQSCSRLRVEAGRLVLDTARGVTYYGELSHGERWRIALDLAIDALPAGGVLTLPQEAWEGLDPPNRQQIAEHVAGRGAVLLTAQASDDERIVADSY